MAKGNSGRVVIEIDPALKRKLYSALAMDDQTLKDWFVANAQQFLKNKRKSVSPRLTLRGESVKVQA